MGVKGLTTFIDTNQELLEDTKLCKTKLILDGNNVYHFVYYNYRVAHAYGGDYLQYRNSVDSFFKSLLTCDIEPYVIFDGGYEKDDRKLQTILGRARSRISSSNQIVAGNGSPRIMPILAYEVFCEVIKELGIQHRTCDYEADGEIASLANYFNCPVLSNDSDFCVFDLTAGYIPLDYVNFKPAKSQESTTDLHLNCQLFKLSNLTQEFANVSNTHMPLFATLLGNDLIGTDVFEAFFNNIKLPKLKSKRIFVSKRNSKMLGVLSWLQAYDDVDEACEVVVSHLKKNERDNVLKMMKQSIEAYKIPVCTLHSVFESEQGNPTEISYTGCVLPAWFIGAIRRCELPVFLLNALTLHRVILLAQIEDHNLPSSWKCALNIRRSIYGMLLGDEAQGKICEYDREKKSLRQTNEEPLYSVMSYGRLPSLNQIPNLSEEERKDIFLNTLGLTESTLSGVHREHWFTTAVLAYWIQNTEPRLMKWHLFAIIVCLITLNVCDTEEVEATQDSSERYESQTLPPWSCIKQCTTSDEKAHLNNNLTRILTTHSNKTKHHQNTNISIVHMFSQLQTCIQAALYLNQLLLSPIPNPSPSLIYDGTLCCKLASSLETRPDPELYTQEILGRKSKMVEFFQDFQTVILSLIDATSEEMFRLNEKTSKKTSKKKKKAKKQDQKQDSSEMITDKSENSESVAQDLIICDLSNRFHGLADD
ncbi:unnamed protein product [Owenia fusiformis]|uniref:Uncharacterized protein n=1 Tax=Owenia fusiformis TaxID=6347 RepID=A0A8J1TUY4_OWEFU|nr:unnamed protein product [Owenia fusiformis]